MLSKPDKILPSFFFMWDRDREREWDLIGNFNKSFILLAHYQLTNHYYHRFLFTTRFPNPACTQCSVFIMDNYNLPWNYSLHTCQALQCREGKQSALVGVELLSREVYVTPQHPPSWQWLRVTAIWHSMHMMASSLPTVGCGRERDRAVLFLYVAFLPLSFDVCLCNSLHLPNLCP